MNDISTLSEELRALIASADFSADERFQVALNRIASFLAGSFAVEKSEVAILWTRGSTLVFLWPDFLAKAKALSVYSQRPVAANIYRSGRSFLDNRMIEREHMVEYEFVKEGDGGSRLIWKMIGAAIAVDGERLGVVQISRKRSAFNEPGVDFTPADVTLLEKLVAQLGPFLKAVVPF
jgi:hypothetical protein